MEKVDIPNPDEWPGVIGTFKLVKPAIRSQIWNFLSVIGIGIILILVLQIIISAIFRTSAADTILSYIVEIIVGALLEASIIAMYYRAIQGQEMGVKEALSYGYSRLFKMAGLVIVIDVILLASLVFLIIPFFFILPRIYIAPYFLVADNLNVNQALATSWHLTKGNVKEVYGIIGIDFLLLILCITIIGIPFAVYWGTINSASFALLVLYIGQTKKTAKSKALQ